MTPVPGYTGKCSWVGSQKTLGWFFVEWTVSGCLRWPCDCVVGFRVWVVCLAVWCVVTLPVVGIVDCMLCSCLPGYHVVRYTCAAEVFFWFFLRRRLAASGCCVHLRMKVFGVSSVHRAAVWWVLGFGSYVWLYGVSCEPTCGRHCWLYAVPLSVGFSSR